jgi:hypothetical protein
MNREKKRAETADLEAPALSARRGAVFERLKEEGWLAKVHRGDLTVADVVEETGESQPNVSRALAAFREDELERIKRDGWQRLPEHEAMLVETPEAFAAFRAAFFVDEKNRPYRTPRAHVRWVIALLHALRTGGRQLILSPPRHGKSQLLVHFVIWLMCRDPNVRIIWVGGNEEIARLMVGAVIDELENNEALRKAMLGPGKSFKPGARSGKGWSSSQATVATRTATGIKSPSIVALGKGGKILSRDADWIVFDDIVDHDSVQSPATRNKDHSWMNTQLSSRKEEHTAMTGIGSRQHHDDMWGRLEKNPAWDAIVEHAHDPECTLPIHGPLPADEHLTCEVCAAHVDCLLFPELRTMRWLQDQRASMADDSLFEMVYQNITHSDGTEYVTVEHLRRCRNHERSIGERPPHTRLIAGLDPATAGFQASILWAFDYESHRRLLVDIDNRRAGGLPGARAVIRDWFERHGVREWVIEAVGYQEAILEDRDIVDFCSRNGIVLHPHITDRFNKWSADFGITKQFSLFKGDPPLIDLPYADQASIDKSRVYEQQILNFEPGITDSRNRRPCDLVMAGWFPETQIRLWIATVSAEIEHETSAGYSSTLMSSLYAPELGDSYGWSGTDQEAIVVGAGV